VPLAEELIFESSELQEIEDTEVAENLSNDASPVLEEEPVTEPITEVLTQIEDIAMVVEETVPPFQITATDEVQQVVEQWLQAWQQQDLSAYFSSYHANFEPISFSSLTTWQNNRERNILRPASIDISYDDYMVLSRNADSTILTLRMTYESPTYADRTLKQLGLIRDEQGEWKIIFEENIQVERLPIDRSRIAGSQAEDRLDVYLVPAQVSQGVPVVGASSEQVAGNLNNQQQQLFNFINNWLASWQNQDVNDYFNHYEDDFRAFNFLSTTALEQDRITKISRPSYIELRMSDFEVLQETMNEAIIQFSLEYRSAYYADRTLKEVLLTRDANGNLQISNELNRQIETLPIYRRINNAVSAIF